MPIFAVALGERNNEIKKAIEKAYPDEHHELQDMFFLIQDPASARDVAVKIRLRGDNQVEDANGVVFKINSAYAGYTYSDLWDWLENAEGKE